MYCDVPCAVLYCTVQYCALLYGTVLEHLTCGCELLSCQRLGFSSALIFFCRWTQSCMERLAQHSGFWAMMNGECTLFSFFSWNCCSFCDRRQVIFSLCKGKLTAGNGCKCLALCWSEEWTDLCLQLLAWRTAYGFLCSRCKGAARCIP